MSAVKLTFDGNVFVPQSPVDLPKGHEITVDLQESSKPKGVEGFGPKVGDGTGRSILESGVVGAWADRTDIGDSVEFARKLRERNQRRKFD